jgi:hypothetical protein
MSATILNTVSNSLLHPVAGMVSAYNSLYKTSKFENMSTVQPGVLAFIIILTLILWIMSIVSTHRLTNSVLQTVLCVFFCNLYVFLAWLYYGLSNNKFTHKIR